MFRNPDPGHSSMNSRARGSRRLGFQAADSHSKHLHANVQVRRSCSNAEAGAIAPMAPRTGPPSPRFPCKKGSYSIFRSTFFGFLDDNRDVGFRIPHPDPQPPYYHQALYPRERYTARRLAPHQVRQYLVSRDFWHLGDPGDVLQAKRKLRRDWTVKQLRRNPLLKTKGGPQRRRRRRR